MTRGLSLDSLHANKQTNIRILKGARNHVSDTHEQININLTPGVSDSHDLLIPGRFHVNLLALEAGPLRQEAQATQCVHPCH